MLIITYVYAWSILWTSLTLIILFEGEGPILYILRVLFNT